MASERRLEGWTLTDGLFRPFALEKACEVAEALASQGILREPYTGDNCLRYEWSAARRWRYAASFELGEEGDERTWLSLDWLCGSGILRVNGSEVCSFSEGKLVADITGWLIPGENAVELEFDPATWERPAQVRPLPRIGIAGQARLATGNFLTVEEARFSADAAGKLTCAMRLDVHTAGRYLFRYGLAGEDGLVAAKEILERLPAAKRTVTHCIDLGKAPDERTLAIKLEIERAGTGCRTLHAQAYFGKPAEKIAACEGPLTREQADVLRDLGADGVCLNGARPMGDSLWEMPLTEEKGERLPVEVAMPSFDDMCALAGEEKFWPSTSLVWQLNGAEDLDERALEERFGPGACANPERLSRLLRFWQAERLQAEALAARHAGKRVCVEQALDSWPRYASRALVEANGRKRPAFWALAGAWREARAFAVLPAEADCKPEELLHLPIRLSGAHSEARAVRVGAYTLRGERIGGATFAAAGGEAGVFTVSAPAQEGALILRCELLGGDETALSVTDQALMVGRALLSLPSAQVRQEHGRMRCEGSTAALGFACEGIYRALLPGESVEADGPAEWLNR